MRSHRCCLGITCFRVFNRAICTAMFIMKQLVVLISLCMAVVSAGKETSDYYLEKTRYLSTVYLKGLDSTLFFIYCFKSTGNFSERGQTWSRSRDFWNDFKCNSYNNMIEISIFGNSYDVVHAWYFQKDLVYSIFDYLRLFSNKQNVLYPTCPLSKLKLSPLHSLSSRKDN